MNSKSTNFDNNSHTATSLPEKEQADLLVPPKTPIKRTHLQPPFNIYSRLSPLPIPPKMQLRTGLVVFVPFEEMRQVETPLVKQKSKFLIDEGQEQFDNVINGRAIFQSQEQDGQNNSSQMESQEDQEVNQGERSPSSNEQNEQGSFSQVERSKEERHGQGDEREGNKSARRSSKTHLKMNPTQNTPGKKISCNCKKTKCLKLYCDCFRLNQTCDGCNCVGCHNLEIYSDQRSNAILALMDRNPDPFGQKIEADKHLKGCNCKKSNCLKKYCECYQAGLKCGQNCKCQECKNIILEKDNEQEKQISKSTAKKERRMLEI